jgi:hypothetical protein
VVLLVVQSGYTDVVIVIYGNIGSVVARTMYGALTWDSRTRDLHRYLPLVVRSGSSRV